MKELNNKGFTLIEIIIAISIFSVILGLGYQVINTSTKTLNNQHNTSKNQMSLNIVNEYLSKDLEQSLSIKYPTVDELNNLNDKSFYEYIISTKHSLVNNIKENSSQNQSKEITYRVEIIKSKNKFLYNLTRKDGYSSLELIYNKELYLKNGNIQAPLTINEDEFIEGLYNVSLNYVDRTYEKQSKFNVVSRYIDNSKSEEVPPEIPDIEIADKISVENQVIIHNQPNGSKYWQDLWKPHYRILFGKSGEEDRMGVNDPLAINTNIRIEYSENLEDSYDDNFYDPYHDRVMMVEFGNTSKKYFANRNQYNATFKYKQCKKVMIKVQAGPDNLGGEQSSESTGKVKFLKVYGVRINGKLVGDIATDTIFVIENTTDKIVVEIEKIERIDNGEADQYQHDDLFVKFGN